MMRKATEREKQMDQAIAEMRQPYDYKITKEKLDKAAIESRKELSKFKEGNSE